MLNKIVATEIAPINAVKKVPVQPDLTNIDIFWDISTKAAVLNITGSDTSFKSDHLFEFLDFQAIVALANTAMDNPAFDKNVILVRQKVMKTIMDIKAPVSKYASEAYDLYLNIKFLYGYDNEEEEKKENLPGYKPVIRITKLFNKVNLILNGPKKVAIENSTPKLEAEFRETLKTINSLQRSLDNAFRLASMLQKTANVILNNCGQEIMAVARSIDLKKPIELLILKDTSGLEQVSSQFKKILPLLNKIRSLVLIAETFKNDGYHLVTFNEQEKESYKNGWIYKLKKEYKSWDKNKNWTQVLNDSLPDTPLTVINGDIMSGKSFRCKQEFWLRSLGQSLGFIPADTGGNLHIFNTIGLISRGLSDQVNHQSSFFKDVDNLKRFMQVMDNTGGRAVLLLDEWGSSTSPDDQKILLLTLKKLFEQRGHKLHVSLHNNLFVDEIKLVSPESLHHMQTDYQENGEVVFSYKHTPGPADYHTLQILRKLNLPSRFIELTTDYMTGKVERVNIPPLKIPALTPYSETERELLKKESRSFLMFFPEDDEIVVMPRDITNWVKSDLKVVGTNFDFMWRYGKRDLHDEMRHHHHSGRDDKEKLSYKYKPNLVLISQDRDFYNWHHGTNSQFIENYKSYIKKLFINSPAVSVQETLEKQKMFELLLENNDHKNVWDSFIKTSNLMWHLARSAGRIFEGLKEFNTFILKEFPENFKDRGYMHLSDIELFREIVKLNANLLGFDMGEQALKTSLEKLEELGKILAEIKELDDNYHRDCDDKVKQDQNIQRTSFLMKSLNELIKIKTDKKEYLPNDELCKKACYLQMLEVLKIVKPHLKKLNLKDMNWDELYVEFSKLKPFIDKALDDNTYLTNDSLRMTDFLCQFLNPNKLTKNLGNKLREFDSVPLHQLANYFDDLFIKFFGGDLSGQDLLKQLLENEDKFFTRYQYADKNFDRTIEETKKLMGLFAAANFMKEQGFCRVDFNSSGEIVLTKPWELSIDKARTLARAKIDTGQLLDVSNELQKVFKNVWTELMELKDEVTVEDIQALNVPDNVKRMVLKTLESQVRNDYALYSPSSGSPERFQIYSGYNGSGKSFGKKTLVKTLLWALATGHAPADYATMPVMDGLVNIDRMQAQAHKNLSAGGTEIAMLRDHLFTYIEKNQLNIISYDEAFSTFPPSDQEALSYAMTQYLIELGHYYVLVTHNHKLIDQLKKLYPEELDIYHYETKKDAEGNLKFYYILKKGHKLSFAIDAAESRGLTPEMIDIARQIQINEK
ncbi:MAG: hypothetical protein PHV30_10255 [Candidatus Margulisbacteria bacterium]|nr:hypothetical protein [Candidatus Margulisiibacteriota bacterium]